MTWTEQVELGQDRKSQGAVFYNLKTVARKGLWVRVPRPPRCDVARHPGQMSRSIVDI